jgi:hypothetical protein
LFHRLIQEAAKKFKAEQAKKAEAEAALAAMMQKAERRMGKLATYLAQTELSKQADLEAAQVCHLLNKDRSMKKNIKSKEIEHKKERQKQEHVRKQRK